MGRGTAVNIHPLLYMPLHICMIKALSLHTAELQLAGESYSLPPGNNSAQLSHTGLQAFTTSIQL